MGEAKRRKQSDPNYGRVPNSFPNRGIVICPPLEISGTRLHIKSTNLDPQELRFALLFWDCLVWPSSRAIYIESGHDETYLQTAGILRRPDYTFNGDIAQSLAKSQIQAYMDLDRAEPGAWAFSQGENSLLLADGFIEEGTGTLIELHRAIPIPKHDVPLEEILEFKRRRQDELKLLRHHLETFSKEIERAGDSVNALQARINEVDQACANLLLVGKEWQFPIYLSNLKASFNFKPLASVPAVAAAWMAGQTYGLPVAAAAAGIAGVVSTFELKADYGMRAAKRPVSPYRYAYRIDRELR